MKRNIQKNAYGGKGEIIIDTLLTPERLNGKCGLYARVTIEPGSSLGFHRHEGDAETYFVISGEAVYDDNGTKRVIKAGDVTYTPDGQGHAVDNSEGKEPIVFMALIILS